MVKIVNMATYPARKIETLCASIASLHAQSDKINLVLNEYTQAPPELAQFSKVNAIIPSEDLKDAGKFYPITGAEDDIFLCDDDILYPPNYCELLMQVYARFKNYNPIIGVHGVIYSDFFDGTTSARLVYPFFAELASHKLVNQLGTGTLHCKGFQMPSFYFMETSQKFVDLRFAVHSFRHNYPMICMARGDQWMQELPTDTAIFSSFTKLWEPHIIKESQEIGGFAKINLELLPIVEASV